LLDSLLQEMLLIPKNISISIQRCQLCSKAYKEKLLVRSTSNNIYRNLALEDWFYQHQNYEKSQILYFYRNTPCVVIGRHQNPWTEANVPFLRKNNINLARRNSGGGTVYHDLGNINISFMTSKQDYDRSKNLNTICAALRRVMDIDVSVNKRDDIVVNAEKKISGTAAKLSRTGAYHHCTLLVNVDTKNLHKALNNPASKIITTNATRSVRSPVENIATSHSNQSTESLIRNIEQAIAQEFTGQEAEIVDIDPCEEHYPGIDEITRQYESWEWVFGKSPKFTFDLGQDDLNISVVNGIMKLPDEEEIKLTKEAIQYLKTSPYTLLWNKLQEVL